MACVALSWVGRVKRTVDAPRAQLSECYPSRPVGRYREESPHPRWQMCDALRVRFDDSAGALVAR